MHYHVGSNMPGYLPDSEPDTCETIEDAIASLIWELEHVEDGWLQGLDEHDCDDVPCPTYGDNCPWNNAQTARMAIEELSQDGASDLVSGGYVTYVGNTAYWLDACAESDCTTEED